MAHWKTMMDKSYLFACDLNGRDVTLTIDKVTAGELTALGGRKSKKPLCFFKEPKDKNRPLALNATNCKIIAALYGNDTDAWIGRRITLYPTTTQMGGETVECIRVRPTVPPEKGIGGPSAVERAAAEQSDPAESESDA